jgi:hypothetical protein
MTRAARADIGELGRRGFMGLPRQRRYSAIETLLGQFLTILLRRTMILVNKSGRRASTGASACGISQSLAAG